MPSVRLLSYELPGRSVVELLITLAPSGLVIHLITYGEISEGIYFGRDPKQSERVFRQFLRSVDVLPLLLAEAEHNLSSFLGTCLFSLLIDFRDSVFPGLGAVIGHGDH